MPPVRDLADDLLAVRSERDPVWATLTGTPGYDDRLPDPSEDAEQALAARAAAIAAIAATGTDDPVTRDVVLDAARSLVDSVAARVPEHTVSDLFTSPVHALLVNLPLVPEPAPGRLEAVPRYLRAVADRHRAGLAAGRSPVAHLVVATIRRLDRHLADPAGDPLRRPGTERLLAEVVRPALAEYREVLAGLVPRSRPPERPGLCWVPGGAAAYAALVRVQTGADHDPAELHRTGLEVLDGLAAEYAGPGRRLFGTADVPTILARLRDDPALRWADGPGIVAATTAAVRRAEAAAPGWFGRLPERRCEVRAVPDAAAGTLGVAYYTPADLAGTRPGVFFVNTADPRGRPRCTAEAVAFHEAVPGHHLQLALAQELTDLPPLRRTYLAGSYVEGWALYAERLADEMGLYSGDLARLGMLTEDACRAARLVVDTGLHAFGWSRRRAVEQLRAATALADAEVEQEVDRYTAEPAQALTYLTGRLEFDRLRRHAESTLGPRFRLPAFHDAVLTHGALPPTALTTAVDTWLTRTR